MRQSARGFAQITPGRLSILTDMVAGEGEIDEDAVAKAIERAQTALANSANMSDEEAIAMEAGLKRNLAMLGVKRRRRYISDRPSDHLSLASKGRNPRRLSAFSASP
jgi:hypothetical protein